MESRIEITPEPVRRNVAYITPEEEKEEKERVLFNHCCSCWCKNSAALWIMVVLIVLTAGFAWAAYGEVTDLNQRFEDDVVAIIEDRFGLEPTN